MARSGREECGYTDGMSETTTVGVRELKTHLSRYLGLVRDGDEIVVTDHGQPVARLVGLDAPAQRLADLVARGIAHPPKAGRRALPMRVKAAGSVSDLVAEQRR